MNKSAEKIKQNLLQTKSYFVDNNLFDNKFVEMIDYAISHWHTANRLMALALLADKEQELIASGALVDEDREPNESGYFAELYDHLSELEDQELGFASLGDLGRASRAERQKKREQRKKDRKDKKNDRKDRRDDRKDDRKDERKEKRDDRKENGNSRANKINKLNPATVAMRNAFRAIIALNMFGFATILNSSKARQKGVYDKVLKMYFNFGGKKDKIEKAIKTGAKKKPVLNNKIRKQLDSGRFSGIYGLGELGEPATIAALIASATAPIITVWKWIKDAGLDKMIEKIPDIIPNKKGREDPNNPNEYLPDKNQNTTYSPDIPDTTDKTNTKKVMIFGTIAVGIIGVGALSYYLYNKKKKATLTGITYN